MEHRKLDVPGFFRHGAPLFPISFEGRSFAAREGETLGLTLLAHGVYTFGRSSKYHRPRGLFCGTGHCGQCLCRAEGLPNQHACLVDSRAGLGADSQHVLGTAETDVLRSIDWLFPRGLDHHRLMTGSSTLNRLTVKMARDLAGHGELPDVARRPSPDDPPLRELDVVVVGAGPAGRAVSDALTGHGVSVLTLEAKRVDSPGVVDQARVVAWHDDGELAYLRQGELERVRPRVTVLATGTMELRPACVGNDVPGLLARRAVEQALARGIRPGLRVALVAEPTADAHTLAACVALGHALAAAQVELAVTVNLDVDGLGREQARGAVASLSAQGSVSGLTLQGAEQFECDAVVWAPRRVPDYSLPRLLGVEVAFEPGLGAFVCRCDPQGRTARDNVLLAGEVAGANASDAAEHGRRVAETVRSALASAARRGRPS